MSEILFKNNLLHTFKQQQHWIEPKINILTALDIDFKNSFKEILFFSLKNINRDVFRRKILQSIILKVYCFCKMQLHNILK